MSDNKQYWDTVDQKDEPDATPKGVIDVTNESKAATEKKATSAKKQHTTDEIERNKTILLQLGLYKKQNGPDKEQFIMKGADITIGRTFSEGYPTGKFWAMREGDLPAAEKFLKDREVKELKIVQAFYDVRDKGGDIKKYMPEDPQKQKQQKQQRQSLTPTRGITREIGVVTHKAKGGYYRVRGHDEPDAWLVQQWANDAGICIEIVTAEQTPTEAKVILRAKKDGQYVDAVVIHEFSTTKDVVAFETIDNMRRNHKNPIVGYEEDGKPILSDEAKYDIYKRYIKFKNFSIRDATTKASRIAILKLMNKEWREVDEIEAEAAEVRSVNE